MGIRTAGGSLGVTQGRVASPPSVLGDFSCVTAQYTGAMFLRRNWREKPLSFFWLGWSVESQLGSLAIAR